MSSCEHSSDESECDSLRKERKNVTNKIEGIDIRKDFMFSHGVSETFVNQLEDLMENGDWSEPQSLWQSYDSFHDFVYQRQFRNHANSVSKSVLIDLISDLLEVLRAGLWYREKLTKRKKFQVAKDQELADLFIPWEPAADCFRALQSVFLFHLLDTTDEQLVDVGEKCVQTEVVAKELDVNKQSVKSHEKAIDETNDEKQIPPRGTTTLDEQFQDKHTPAKPRKPPLPSTPTSQYKSPSKSTQRHTSGISQQSSPLTPLRDESKPCLILTRVRGARELSSIDIFRRWDGIITEIFAGETIPLSLRAANIKEVSYVGFTGVAISFRQRLSRRVKRTFLFKCGSERSHAILQSFFMTNTQIRVFEFDEEHLSSRRQQFEQSPVRFPHTRAASPIPRRLFVDNDRRQQQASRKFKLMQPQQPRRVGLSTHQHNIGPPTWQSSFEIQMMRQQLYQLMETQQQILSFMQQFSIR